MKINLYSIFDSAASAYRKPFFMQADGEAMRGFSDLCMNAESEIGKHPEDYSLCRHGSFSDADGKVFAEDVCVLITGIKAVAESRKVDGNSLDKFDMELESIG